MEKEVIFNQKSYKTKVYNRDKLESGNEIEGSSIIVEYTLVIPPFAKARIDKFKNIIVEIN